VGQHVRHIIEFYQCLFEGIPLGIINYDRRKRDRDLENDVHIAQKRIHELKKLIPQFNEDMMLYLEVNYSTENGNNHRIKTSFLRELTYNIEHTIHHMAIIKSTLEESFPYIKLPENFGIASSTIRYRNQVTF
jgi:hypothetical protein